MARDVSDVSDLVKEHDNTSAIFRIPRHGGGIADRAAVAKDNLIVTFSKSGPAERLFAAASGRATRIQGHIDRRGTKEASEDC